MTIAQHYADHAVDGRAVLRRLHREPDMWVTRPVSTEDVYCVCFANKEAIRFVPGTQPIRSSQADA